MEIVELVEKSGEQELWPESKLLYEIGSLLAELVEQVEAAESPAKSESSLFNFVTTCDSCNVQDSFYWRRVARNKIVCNNCFFSQTYLLKFGESKLKREPELNELDAELDEPIRYVKKTRASLKNIQDMPGCLTESDVNKTLSQKPFLSQLSSSSSSVSSSSKKSEAKCEDEAEMDEFAYAKTRKSARFLNHSNNKTKSSEGTKTKPNTKKIKKIVAGNFRGDWEKLLWLI